MNKLTMRHWSHVSSVLFIKNVTCHARELLLAQNCRCMSKKVVIRWPKAFPSPDQPQASRTKPINFTKKHKERHFRKSSPVVKNSKSSGTTELLDEVIVKHEKDEYEEEEFTSDEIEETDLDEFESSEQLVPLHFGETDLGMSGTFVIKGRNTDRVIEDLKTSQLVNDEACMVNDDEVHVSDDDGRSLSARVGGIHNTGVGSSLAGNLKERRDAKYAIDKKLHAWTLTHKGNDVNEEKGHSRGDISFHGEQLSNEEGAVTDEDEVTHQNTLERRNDSWKEIKLLKRQNQSKQQKRGKKLYIHPKNEVLFGISPCFLALLHSRRQIVNAFVLEAFEISARPEAQEIMKMLGDKGVKMHVRSRGELNRLSEGRPHQGVCLEVSRLQFENLANISGELITADNDSRVCLLALDKIMDPMNLGALMRSAYFLGVDKVVANKQNCCPLTPIVSKASSGICEVMPIYSAMDMVKFVGELGEYGWHIIGATNELDTGQGDSEKPTLPCSDVKLSKPTVVVIGSEGFGLRKSIQALCQTFVTVPPGRTLHLGIDSLNVSVATGILLHSLLVNR